MKSQSIRHVSTVTELDIPAMCDLLLSRQFGTTEVDQLTSYERKKAYNTIKGRLEQSARSLDDFERKLQHVTDYLQV